MPTTSPLKRRGAPFGNRNALKHGYYAHTFRASETRTKADAAPPESMADEIALIRVLIRRVIEKTTGQESMAESLEILRTVSQAVSALARLQRAQHLVSGGPQDEIQQALQEALVQFHSQLDLANDLAAAAADFQPEPGFSILPPAEGQSLSPALSGTDLCSCYPQVLRGRISDLGSSHLTPIVFTADNSPTSTVPPSDEDPSRFTDHGSPITGFPELTPIVFSANNSRSQPALHAPAAGRPRHTRKRHRPSTAQLITNRKPASTKQ